MCIARACVCVVRTFMCLCVYVLCVCECIYICRYACIHAYAYYIYICLYVKSV